MKNYRKRRLASKFGEWFFVNAEGPFIQSQAARDQLTYPGYEHISWEAFQMKGRWLGRTNGHYQAVCRKSSIKLIKRPIPPF